MQEDPREDRDWELWPGRRSSDEGIRHRLKALFSATDAEDSIEALIDEKGREIEERTGELQTTISDLERREERTGQLRSAVEEMLRHGSTELDERQAALTALALDLATREEKVRTDERDIAVRKQELGAVELRRAAVERREDAVSERETTLGQLAADLTERTRELAEEESVRPTAELVELSRAGTILYLAGDGYRMVERPGRAAPVGALLEIDGARYVVTRLGRSPRPGDGRTWAYLEVARTSVNA